VTRRLLRFAFAVPLLAIGLGTASAAARTGPATPVCAQAATAHHVGVVVEHGNGQVLRQCVSFATATITALSALKASGIENATQTFGGSLGDAVCQIDHEPTSYSQCLPSSGSYWVFFVARAGGSWTNAAQGISNTALSDGDDAGFRYDPLAGADPPPASPVGTCPTSTPTPGPTPTAAPTPTPAPTKPPAGTSTPTPPQATSRPPSTTSSEPFPIITEGPSPSAVGSGQPSPGDVSVPVARVSPAAGASAGFAPGLLVAIVAGAALIALLGVQGLRRRRR
jgi:cell division septation protein DedD